MLLHASPPFLWYQCFEPSLVCTLEVPESNKRHLVKLIILIWPPLIPLVHKYSCEFISISLQRMIGEFLSAQNYESSCITKLHAAIFLWILSGRYCFYFDTSRTYSLGEISATGSLKKSRDDLRRTNKILETYVSVTRSESEMPMCLPSLDAQKESLNCCCCPASPYPMRGSGRPASP